MRSKDDTGRTPSRRAAWWVAGLALAWWAAAPAPACIMDLGIDDGSPPTSFLFPNWTKALVSIFDSEWCDSLTCPGAYDATVVGLTLLNYGTATGGPAGDLTGVYTCFVCSTSGGTCAAGGPPGMTMTYAGIWNVNGTNYPAWTWDGSLALDANPCSSCGCVYNMSVFVDIAKCPANGATVQMGPNFDDITDPLNPGGLTDADGCDGPASPSVDPAPKIITYALKDSNADAAAPGDTITYTITYGRPGAGPLTGILIVDTLPQFTHYVAGSSTPPPIVGFDPDLGPPMRLLWTVTWAGITTGGPTGQIVFQATVDWGNGETFEPGSGDTAAPEGLRLLNTASVNYLGAGCPVTNWLTYPASTVVQRFLFWKVGDNDLLFGPQPGTPPDEMIYEIFIKNQSAQKTWWSVRVWDTVPAELNPWGPGFGLEDPCQGWTMTPSGCAAASPGWYVTGGKTVLTWTLDMPAAFTVSLRWKAQLRPTVIVGSTVINQASILEMGQTGIIGGTGPSTTPVFFTHLAPVILPTTYISYVAMAMGDDEGKIGCKGYFISFFPLNKQTQFELRGIEYHGGAPNWANNGGASQSIGCLIGDCINGFPGSAACTLGQGAISGGGIAGCKAERSPAVYDPSAYAGTCAPGYPLNNIYKVTSNSPTLWQLLTHIGHDAQDNFTYAPSTTITYRGFMHYMWRRAAMDTYPGDGDALSLINTGLDQYGVFHPAQPTTVYLFEWNYASLEWDFYSFYNLAAQSQAIDLGPDIPDEAPYRTMSSQTQLIVYQGNDTINPAFCCCGCGDNFGGFCPNQENGNVVSIIGAGSFYGIAAGYANTPKGIVGNTGAVDATYEIWRYQPDVPIAVGSIPSMLAGSSGTWGIVAVDTVPAGLAAAGNPRVYGNTLNSASHSLWKIKLVSGGPIQVMLGVNIYQTWSGGSVMHAANGGQSGIQYYWNHVASGGSSACKSSMNTVGINVFCSKAGMAIRGQSERGYSATYTTNGPDQCVLFQALSDLGSGKENFRFDSLTGAAAIAQYQQCFDEEKGFTAPFLQTGVHYQILAPPVAFVGQPFWITVIVIEANATKDDYCGTTSFTSTDPAAKIEVTAMDLYNYTWRSSVAPCNGGGDNGVRVFFNVIFSKIGVQTLEGIDTLDGSISGIVSVLVVSADIKLEKLPRLQVGASGDTVQFRICWSNYSSASGFSFVVTDAVPNGTAYLPEVPSAMTCGDTDGVPVTVAYSTVAQATPPAMTTTAVAPPAATRWLRWTFGQAGVQTTGCACFRVVVN